MVRPFARAGLEIAGEVRAPRLKNWREAGEQTNPNLTKNTDKGGLNR